MQPPKEVFGERGESWKPAEPMWSRRTRSCLPQPGWELPTAAPSTPLPEGYPATWGHFTLLECHRTHLMLTPLLFLLQTNTSEKPKGGLLLLPQSIREHLLGAPRMSMANGRLAKKDQELSSYSRQEGGHPEMPSGCLCRKFVGKSSPMLTRRGNYTLGPANLMDFLLIWIKFNPEGMTRPYKVRTCKCKGTSSICWMSRAKRSHSFRTVWGNHSLSAAYSTSKVTAFPCKPSQNA